MKTKLLGMLLLATLFLNTKSFAQQEGLIGEVKLFAGNFAPRGWAFCDGQLLAIASNTALFSILGTTYGGDGRTTFALPDLRGRVAIGPRSGPGLSTYQLGQKSGSESKILTTNQLPSHSHTVSGVSTIGNSNDPTGKLPAQTGLFDNEYSDAPADVQLNSTMIGNTGTNQPVDIRQPSLSINYIICLTGIFPSRS